MIYRAFSEINRYNNPYQIISRTVKYQSFVINIINILGALYLISRELRARVGRPQTSSSPPVIFIAGRPKAAFLFWFFGDFRCGALLFMVIHVIYKYKNR